MIIYFGKYTLIANIMFILETSSCVTCCQGIFTKINIFPLPFVTPGGATAFSTQKDFGRSRPFM
ncbi:MAG TPA: hypothetical protein ACFYEM_08280 [Candidatus Hypogeohydataceae bacterium YC40]